MRKKLRAMMEVVRRAAGQPTLDSPSAVKRGLIRIFQVLALVWKGFKEDDLLIHASALTYATLMSLVPLLAIVFSVLRGLGAGQEQIDKLLEWKKNMPQEFQSFIDQVVEVVGSTNFATLGWLGLAALILIAVMVLGSMETSFNRIWAVKRSRNILRRIANYISILVVVPILMGLAGTVSAFLRSPAVMERLGAAAGLYGGLLRLTPLLGTWMAFIFLYALIPNTRVSPAAALLSSLITALLWLGWQKLYVTMQVGVARYNAIYGTFASIPIFLAWLYTSWVIVLLGAEISFAIQNQATFHLESAASHASTYTFTLLAVMVAARAARELRQRGRFSPAEFAHAHRVPVRLVNAVISFLTARRWIAELAERPGTYIFSRDPRTCTAADLARDAFHQGADLEILGIRKRIPGPLVEMMRRIEACMEAAGGGITLADLADLSGETDTAAEDPDSSRTP